MDVIIPGSITIIRDGAFSSCPALTSITIPEGVETIGKDVFYACLGLEEFIVADENKNFTTIDGILTNKEKTVLVQFPNAKSSDVSIPESIMLIGEGAFAGCDNVNSVSMPDNVTTIAPWAFADCEHLTKITLGNKVDFIGSNAFRNCKLLESFDFPESIVHITDSIFYGCTGLNSVTMPDNVITIGNMAFWQCNDLQNMELGKNIISIGDYAFGSCRAWENDIVLEKVVSIGDGAFLSCGKVKEMVLGKALKEIGESAFVQMTALEAIYNHNPSPIVIEHVLYYGIHPSIDPPTMYVPVGSGNAYRSIPAWNVFIIEEKEGVANEAVNREAVTITAASGGITINSAELVQVSIYAITGQPVFQKSFAGRLEIPLPRGLYIVKTNYLTKKVFVQ